MQRFTLFLLLMASAFPEVFAHTQGEDYITLNVRENSIDGFVHIFIEDLEEKLELVLNESGVGSQDLIDNSTTRIQAYLEKGFSIGSDSSTFPMEFGQANLIESERDGIIRYLVEFPFEIEHGPVPDIITIKHDILYEGDPSHRGIVMLNHNHKTNTSYGEINELMVFSKFNREQELDLTNPRSSILNSKQMIPQGIIHIWFGIDHILFLFALMIPTVLLRKGNNWEPVSNFKRASLNILKIVTVFTIAHSITLALAAFDFITIPSRIVESIIALSIIMVALNNIFGKVRDGSILVVLGFGLFHGLGFASVMGQLPFRTVQLKLIKGVIGFNIGVELGQLVIVGLVFPVLYLLRNRPIYQSGILKGGSLALVVISSIWFIQRAFGIG
jgi:hypothetical protein